MTKAAMKIFRQLHAVIVESGVSRSGMNPAARDGYAALWLWMNGGQPIERLNFADIGPIPPDLRLDAAPLARQAVGYILPGLADWLVLARVAAEEPIRVARSAFAYPEPMLVWCGWCGDRGSIRTGCVNLLRTPTVAGLRLAPGANYGELGASPIDQGAADDDLLAVGMCLPRFYGFSRERGTSEPTL